MRFWFGLGGLFLAFLGAVAGSWLVILAGIAVAGYCLWRSAAAASLTGAAWIGGAAFVAAGSLQNAWVKGDTRGVFLALQVVGMIAIVFGFVALPAAADRRGVWPLLSGMALTLLGVATAFAGIGVPMIPIGLALYCWGAVRGGVLTWHAIAAAVALISVSLLLAWQNAVQTLSVELAAGAAFVIGVAVYSANGGNRATSGH
jgi:hypothetical protein